MWVTVRGVCSSLASAEKAQDGDKVWEVQGKGESSLPQGLGQHSKPRGCKHCPPLDSAARRPPHITLRFQEKASFILLGSQQHRKHWGIEVLSFLKAGYGSASEMVER